VKGETEHFGCAQCDSAYCVCCTELCSTEPSVQLKCGHAMHLRCAQNIYIAASDKGRIVPPKCAFSGCREIPQHPALSKQVDKWEKILTMIHDITVRTIKEEKVDCDMDHVRNPMSPYFRKPMELARDTFTFFMCSQCKLPYYGGRIECGRVDPPENACLCGRCSREFCSKKCRKHGDGAMIYKCCWCCKPALFYCWGSTYFCQECHVRSKEITHGPWPACDGKCQFHPHPPNGTRQIIGYCTTCEAERVTGKRK
jgi:E3 ubiquitin-protein ligase MYCBP2